MSANETKGNHYNCPCPHCGRINNYVTHNIEVPFREVKVFTKPCHYCKKDIYYSARWEIQVSTSTENPLQQSSFAKKLAADPELAAKCKEVATKVREAAREDIEAGERSNDIGPQDLRMIINM